MSVLRIKRHRAAFTLVELLTVLAIVAILASLVIVGVGKARMRGKMAASSSNLREIGTALNLYAADNNGRLPLLYGSAGWNVPFWSQLITPYLAPTNKDASIYTNLPPNRDVSRTMLSPLLEDGLHMSLGDYGANPQVIKYWGGAPLTLTQIPNPSRTVSVMEAEELYNGLKRGSYFVDTTKYVSSSTAPSSVIPSDRGTGTIFSLFADGHVEGINKQDFWNNRRRYLYLNP